MAKLYTAIGLMSGTSMDGIDVALLRTDGEEQLERVAFRSYAYDEAFRARLAAGLSEAQAIRSREQRPGSLGDLERAITERHARAVDAFLRETGTEKSGVDLIGFHGQTVLHRPAEGITVQLGDGGLLSRLTGRPSVSDMRAADVAAGGEGAPLAPAYHRALARLSPDRPAVFVNIGGVSNVTWVGRDDNLLAFDAGPGNALMDDWALRHTGQPIDRDGELARSGEPDSGAIKTYLHHRFFEQPVPKSLDRGDFTLEPVEHLSPADGAATLAQFTASAIAGARAWFPDQPQYWYVCGGGRRNRFLMELLAWHLEAPVAPVEALGFDGDALEAEAWAYLAVRSLMGLPLSFPGTTGVREPMTGGVLHQP